MRCHTDAGAKSVRAWAAVGVAGAAGWAGAVRCLPKFGPGAGRAGGRGAAGMAGCKDGCAKECRVPRADKVLGSRVCRISLKMCANVFNAMSLAIYCCLLGCYGFWCCMRLDLLQGSARTSPGRYYNRVFRHCVETTKVRQGCLLRKTAPPPPAPSPQPPAPSPQPLRPTPPAPSPQPWRRRLAAQLPPGNTLYY